MPKQYPDFLSSLTNFLCVYVFLFQAVDPLLRNIHLHCSGLLSTLLCKKPFVLSIQSAPLHLYVNIKKMFGLTLQEHKYISSKRIAHLYSSKPQPHEFTVMVSGIPLVSGNSISETVENFFREYHSSSYLSHIVVHRTDKLKILMVSFST